MLNRENKFREFRKFLPQKFLPAKISALKVCYMGTDTFIIHIKTKDVYNDIVNDVDTSNYEINRPLPKCKKVIGLMKDELGGKIMTESFALRPKTFSYLINDGSNDKKAKGTNKCVMKGILKFNYYRNCSLNNKIKF